MRDAGAEALAPALSSVHLTTLICTLTRLKCLDISCNQIVEGCLQDLARMVVP